MKKAFFQLHFAIFLAGFTGVLGKLITLNESLLVWYRMLFSMLILLCIAAFTKKVKLLSIKKMAPLVAIGGLIALHWVFFYGSVKYANISVSLVCFSAIGFFTSLLDPLFSKRKIIIPEIILGLLVMLGIYLIFHFDEQYRIGILFGIISSFFASIFPILNKKIIGQYDPDTISFYELGGGWFCLNFFVPLYLFFIPEVRLIPNSSDLFWLIILSLFCTVLAFNMSVRSLKFISPFTVNLSYNLEPIYGILLAFIVYNENKYLGFSFYIGFAIIFITVVIQSWRVWKTEKSIKIAQ
jgi:drug/metabolite transporter (DMT)-like permease